MLRKASQSLSTRRVPAFIAGGDNAGDTDEPSQQSAARSSSRDSNEMSQDLPPHLEEQKARFQEMRKHMDEWVPELAMTCHLNGGKDGEYSLDVYPIYRTWACSMASDYTDGYHPVLPEKNAEL